MIFINELYYRVITTEILNSNIEMYFQRENLASGSINFYPETGDIVDWNEHYWEICETKCDHYIKFVRLTSNKNIL